MVLFPSLRSKASPGARYAQRGSTPGEIQGKVALAEYYSALANAGYVPSRDAARPWPIERAVAEGYERLIWGFKGIEAISGSSSSLTYRLRSGSDVVDDEPICHLLNVQANPMESGWIFRKRLSQQFILSKPGAFVEVGASNAGTPIRLDLLPPGRTRIIPDQGAKGIDHYELWGRDGYKIRNIEPENVRWCRSPHPTDPYSGVTPLEAAGLSVELDHFARLWNVSFLRNDGRPGGLVGVGGVDEDVSPETLAYIEKQFSKGPHNAGKLTALAGQLSFIDLGSNPRDMQYGLLAKNAKTEILVALGVPESQLGNASDKTFSNADAEAYAYWTITMAQHNRAIVATFEADSPPGLKGFLDTSEIEVLQEAERKRRQEAREEFTAGLRSPLSYARLAGYGDEIEDQPETRALYLASGKTQVAARVEDKAPLGLATGGGSGAADAGAPAAPGTATAALQRLDPGAGDSAGGPDALAGSGGTGGAGSAAVAALAGTQDRPALPAAPTPAAGPVGASLFDSPPPNRTASQVVSDLGGKAARPPLRLVVSRGETKAAAPARESQASDALLQGLETEVQAALDSLVARWAERTVGRLEGRKARRGTRHWTAEYDIDTRVGVKALDSARIVDPDRFAAEAQAVLYPVVREAAVASGSDLVDDLDWQEALPGDDPDAPVDSTSIEQALAVAATASLILGDGEQDRRHLPRWLLRRVLRRSVADVLNLIATSATRVASRLADAVNEADQRGASIADITAVIREWASAQRGWTEGLSVQVATATVEGARSQVVEGAVVGGGAPVSDIMRAWRTRRDDKVRETHKDADGQKRDVGASFLVGGVALRYPGDPLGPLRETAGCRCRMTVRSKTSGRFAPLPLTATGS